MEKFIIEEKAATTNDSGVSALHQDAYSGMQMIKVADVRPTATLGPLVVVCKDGTVAGFAKTRREVPAIRANGCAD